MDTDMYRISFFCSPFPTAEDVGFASMMSILEVFSNRTEKSIHVWIKVHCNYLITHLYLVTNQNQNKMTTTTSTRTSPTTDKH